MKLKPKRNKIQQMLFRLLQIIIIGALLSVIFVIMRGIYFRMQDAKNINQGIQALQSDIDKFSQENKKLNKMVQYLDSVEFQEKEIKEKLNLVKEGENLIVVQEGKTEKAIESSTDSQKNNNIITVRPNYYYWWKYFFNN